MKCKHCKYLEYYQKLINDRDISKEEKHLLITDLFVYLHDGKDYCKDKKPK